VRFRRPRGRTLYGLLLVISGAAAVTGIVWWSQANNDGTIIESSQIGVRYESPIKMLSGEHLKFMYKNVYGIKKLLSGGDDIEQYFLTADTNYPKTLAVDLTKFDGSLNGDIAYAARKNHPELYTSEVLNVNGGSAEEFVKTDFTERTIFIPHGNSLAILSFVSGNKYEDLQTEILALLGTFQWKQ
jgi:hypothetical protein